MGPELCRIAFLDKSYIADSSSPSITAEDFIMFISSKFSPGWQKLVQVGKIQDIFETKPRF